MHRHRRPSAVPHRAHRYRTGHHRGTGPQVPDADQGAGPRGRRADRDPEGQALGHRQAVRGSGRGAVPPMKDLVESVLRGLGTGSVYALLALGFVIIYKSTRVISFAQPAFMLTGAVLVTYLVGPLGFFLALPVAALATAGLALGVE